MILDTSALIAILRDEPDAAPYVSAIAAAPLRRISAAKFIEAAIVIAYRDFGRASGHPARLNFGDRSADALAKSSGEPLLFKGRDLAHTDVAPALPAAPTL